MKSSCNNLFFDNCEYVQELQRISSSLIEEDNIDALYEKILAAACAVMCSETASIQMLVPERNELFLLAHRGFEWTSTEEWQWVGLNHNSSCAIALARKERVFISDVENSDLILGIKAIEPFRKLNIRALQSTPLISRSGRLVGMISTHWSKVHYPNEQELRLLDVVARQAADLIERLSAEKALRESEVRFRALVLASSSMLYQMNADWTEMICFEKGNVSREYAKKPNPNWLEDFIPPEDRDHVKKAVQAVIDTKNAFELEHRLVQNGKIGWAFSCAVPLLNKKGEIMEWFGAATDITERKNIEQTLKETDRRKDEFLAVLAHELRNPLFPVKNAIYILQHNENNTPQQQHLINIMQRQVDHMVRLVEDLLEVSRIATAKIELRRETINLADAINNAIEVSQPLLNRYQHQLVLSIPSESMLINADIVRMTQVFANLLNNAAKYTAENGTITINAFQENNKIVISVKDNGIGISAKMLPNVFELFTQDKHPVDPNTRGLGIGLAMVKNLVELHGGSVKAFSAGHKQGSEFIVYLPIDEKYKKVVEKNDIVVPAKKSYFSNVRILIVDDNYDITNSLSILLTSWKMNVQTVNNGNGVLEIIGEFNPHLILLDIGLPDMDGYEVAEKIRQNPKYADIKLVALTGWGQEKDRAKARANGFNEHLTKPVDIDVLRRLFNEFVV